jgi:hypothetical protein
MLLPFLAQIELFISWNPEAKGTVSPSGWTEPLAGEKLWDKELYRPYCLTWSGIKGASDFFSWLFPQETPELPSRILFWGLGASLEHYDLSSLPQDRLVLFRFEPPVVEPRVYEEKVLGWFDRVYTWQDDKVDGIKFFKFFYPVWQPQREKLIPFQEKKLATLIATRLSSSHPNQLYSEREKVIRYFEGKEGFDLYGRGWEKRKFLNWRGPIEDKLECLSHYKFAFAYENTKGMNGYITEKIFDCFAARTVPIYWGAPNIGEWIGEECFIDASRYSSVQELHQYLESIDEVRYQLYLDAAESFLNSEAALPFKKESFFKLLEEAFTSSKDRQQALSRRPDRGGS